MNGFGFMVYQLPKLPPPAQMLPVLRAMGVQWLSIKVADGTGTYNQTGGNDKILRDENIAIYQAAGIRVGGWGYTYGVQPGPEAARAAERIDKLNLDFWQINAEKEYRKTGGKKSAETYIKTLAGEVNKKFHVSLCSYRYPVASQPDFPWGGWLNNDLVTSVSPQVYWLQARNPVAQLTRCRTEYATTTHLPVIPIGCTFGERGWEPLAVEIGDFSAAAGANHGFYSLDWMISHQRADWLDALGGMLPVEAAPAVPDCIRVKTKLNLRSKPMGTIIGSVPPRLVLPVDDSQIYQGKVWYRSGPAWFAGWCVEVVV